MNVKKLVLKSVAIVAAACMFSLQPASAADEGKIIMDGSTTVGPIAKAFASYYMEHNKGVNVTVSESGSGNGAKSLINGTCDIGNMSRPMKEKEFKAAVEKGITPVMHVVALDGLAIVVNPKNPLKNLTIDQIKAIYKGEITTWDKVGGPAQQIVVISRDTNSGTYETFEKRVMGKEKIVDSAEYVGSNGAVSKRVASTDFAVGYVGVGFIDKNVKAITVNNIPATVKTVRQGKYPISRPLFMVTSGYPAMGSHVYQFVTLHLTKDGQQMVEKIGFVPVTEY